MALAALVFDVDGTLAETECAHLAAFNASFAAFDLPFRWDEALYRSLLTIAGGHERIYAWWKGTGRPMHGPDGEDLGEFIARLHARKTQAYVEALADGQVRLRPGVAALMEEARQRGLRLALATTTTPANIEALLCPALGSTWRTFFACIEDGHSAPLRKPHPQVYRQVLDALGLVPAACMAFEDSRNGLLAARAARMPCVVTPSYFTQGEDFSGATHIMPDLCGIGLHDLT